ncbi:DapH/DapD/GlmU-related protein [Planococcus sp. ISL-110]|uniref:acyltransferase n=1 Tax=Planococcus sp. ISL-110 TaxID=2819167 RepID=UPI001BE71E4F|nr:DapH/DapD/GlmU-related protein [Planococcus sp. ISL-110]MBT2572032.1 hypothetical protein [Planococcus sp. ISL-110]
MNKYIRYAITRMKSNPFRYYSSRLRAIYYNIFYTIGKGCSFQKVKFYKPSQGKMGKKSIQIGKRVIIMRGTELIGFNNLPTYIGENTFINQECLIRPHVSIGKNVSVGMRVGFISDTHEIGTLEKRAGKALYAPITVGDGCWIGANCTILGNVTIGNGTVIAAGSVVIKDCEANSVYAGTPAKFIKSLKE